MFGEYRDALKVLQIEDRCKDLEESLRATSTLLSASEEKCALLQQLNETLSFEAQTLRQQVTLLTKSEQQAQSKASQLEEERNCAVETKKNAETALAETQLQMEMENAQMLKQILELQFTKEQLIEECTELRKQLSAAKEAKRCTDLSFQKNLLEKHELEVTSNLMKKRGDEYKETLKNHERVTQDKFLELVNKLTILTKALIPSGLPPRTSLLEIVQEGDLDKIKFLLDLGAMVNEANQFGSTPLHVAVFYNRKDAASLLLSYGANVYATNAEGLTARDVARARGHHECMALFHPSYSAT